MKQYTITIPDNKVSLFIEMMKNVSFVKHIEECDTAEIPESHKSIVRERVANYKNTPESYLDLDTLEDKLDLDS